MKRVLRQLVVIEPVESAGASAATYVPWVMVSRGLAFVRTLVVARLLGEAGKIAFGIYQPALEFINPLTALVLFGAADVAERYVAGMELKAGRAALCQWILEQWLRLGMAGVGAVAILLAGGRWISAAIWGDRDLALLAVCGGAVILLALYQHMAAVLRGLRAYGAAAGMELLAAVLLLAFSTWSAWRWSPRQWAWDDLPSDWEPAARSLVVAYGGSVAVPLVVYGALLLRHLARREGVEVPGAGGAFAAGDVAPYAAQWRPPRMTRFAAWALVRLLLVLLFGFLSIWGVGYLAVWQAGPETIAAYSMPYRMAQLLGFLAVTLWSSSYGIAARAWSHGQVRRARMQMFRVGRLGLAGLMVLAVGMLLLRGMFGYSWALPHYAEAIGALLPALLALFIWYALAAFFSALADLHERPQGGAAIWGVAVGFQVAGIGLAKWGVIHMDPQRVMLGFSGAGLLAGLGLVTPWLFSRRGHWVATGMPLAAMGAAAGALWVPAGMVNWVAAPVMLGTVGVLYLRGDLMRAGDWRAGRRWRRRRAR